MIGALIVKKMMHKGYELLSQGNLSEFLKDWADDSVFVYPGNAKVSGTFKGKTEIEKWFKHMIEQYPERKFTVQNVYVRNICVLEQRMGRQSNGKLTLRIKREKSIRISV